MNVLNFELVGNVLRKVSGFEPVSGGENVDACRFALLDKDFHSQIGRSDGVVTAVFWQYKDAPYYADVALSDGSYVGTCTIPAGVLNEAGTVNLSILLGAYSSGPLTQFSDTGTAIFTSTIAQFSSKMSAISETDTEQPTLSLYASLLEVAGEAVKASQTAVTDSSVALHQALETLKQSEMNVYNASTSAITASGAAEDAQSFMTASQNNKDDAEDSAKRAARSAADADVSAKQAANLVESIDAAPVYTASEYTTGSGGYSIYTNLPAAAESAPKIVYLDVSQLNWDEIYNYNGNEINLLNTSLNKRYSLFAFFSYSNIAESGRYNDYFSGGRMHGFARYCTHCTTLRLKLIGSSAYLLDYQFAEPQDTGWKTIQATSAVTENTLLQYRKLGSQVFLQVNIRTNISNGKSDTLFTLPAEYRPSQPACVALPNYNHKACAMIGTDGTVHVEYVTYATGQTAITAVSTLNFSVLIYTSFLCD